VANDPLALDVVAGEIIGLSRANNPVLIAAEKRGLYPNRLEDVQLVGADIADLRILGYKMPSTVFEGAGLGPFTWLAPVFKNAGTLQPRVIKDVCVACGSCYDACPVDAITMNDHALINNKACIRCYCCHEMCPDEAIELRSSLLYRILN
jgi:ferredoxin